MSESKGQTVHFGATMGGAGKSLFTLHLDALSHTFVIAPTGSGMSFNPVAAIGNPSDTDTDQRRNDLLTEEIRRP